MKQLSYALAVSAALVTAAHAQVGYDFDHLNGSDTHPFTPLDGQDGWSEETFNANNPCGVTETLSHDGTKSLRFQEVGPGYGTDASRINDANWSYAAFTGSETSAFFQADIHVGFWGGTFGLAHDVNGNMQIRGSEAGERGVRFVIGTQANVQLKLVSADQTSTTVPLSGLGIAGGNWVRMRVVMDLTVSGGTGSVLVQNITTGGTALVPVPGLQDIPLALDMAATDATNPTLWDAVWLHFEGATYGMDNMLIGSQVSIGTSYCGPAVANSSGQPAAIFATGSNVAAADDVTLVAVDLPDNQFGYFLNSLTQGFVQNPGGSQGNLCLGGQIGRYNTAIFNTGATGMGSLVLDLPNTPTPTGTTAIVAGDTWNFTCWFRDNNPGPTSNFTDGRTITFM